MAQLQRASFSLQETIYTLLSERPDLRRHLTEMVEWERKQAANDKHSEWEWQDVHTPPTIINMLIARSIVNRTYASRGSQSYQLVSLEDTAEALSINVEEPVAEPAIDLKDLFRLVYGHDKVKSLLTMAVKADAAVHCLLEGAPGTAKTLLLSDVGRLPGSHFYVGSTTTRSGLVGLLIDAKPRFLVIDELDKMTDVDMSPMLNLMEDGVVTRLQHGVRERIKIETKVFAGANDIRRISPAILSRFAKFHIETYTTDEFLKVTCAVLIHREGQGPQMAKLIADEVSRHSNDIRDAVRVARFARSDPQLVIEAVSCLWPKTGKPQLMAVPQRSK